MKTPRRRQQPASNFPQCPPIGGWTTETYIIARFANRYDFKPCTYIVNGKEVVA